MCRQGGTERCAEVRDRLSQHGQVDLFLRWLEHNEELRALGRGEGVESGEGLHHALESTVLRGEVLGPGAERTGPQLYPRGGAKRQEPEFSTRQL